MVFQLCCPVWQAWTQAAILSGALAVDRNDPEIYDLDWIPQGWPWVDPLKDVQGKLTEVRSGFLSRTKVVSEQGYDAEEMDREIASHNERADSLGLVFDSMVARRQRPAKNKPSLAQERARTRVMRLG
jgi:capsid protein